MATYAVNQVPAAKSATRALGRDLLGLLLGLLLLAPLPGARGRVC